MLCIMHCLVNRHCDRWLPNKSAFKEFKGKINPPKKVRLPLSSFQCIYRDLTKIFLIFSQKEEDKWVYSAVIFTTMKTGSGGTGDAKAAERERGRVTGTQKEDSDDEESTSLLNNNKFHNLKLLYFQVINVCDH